jgi:hypothetical protein
MERGVGMDQLRELLENVKQSGSAKGNLRGLLHILIGRSITLTDGTVVSTGLTWRELANQLKLVRWETDTVAELGLEAEALPPRDRQRFWYTAISQAGVDSEAARTAGDKLTTALKKLGYVVGPGPK